MRFGNGLDRPDNPVRRQAGRPGPHGIQAAPILYAPSRPHRHSSDAARGRLEFSAPGLHQHRRRAGWQFAPQARPDRQSARHRFCQVGRLQIERGSLKAFRFRLNNPGPRPEPRPYAARTSRCCLRATDFRRGTDAAGRDTATSQTSGTLRRPCGKARSGFPRKACEFKKMERPRRFGRMGQRLKRRSRLRPVPSCRGRGRMGSD
jgi:hypothetical protein